MSDKQPTVLVIVGITGDLAQQKLLPAIERIAAAGELPEQFQIVGISRRDVSLEEIAPTLKHPYVSKRLKMYRMDLEEAEDYAGLESYLSDIERPFSGSAQRLFYLSVPPQASQPVIQLLGEAGFGKKPDTKLLLEKPFGSDLESAQDLVEHIKEYFEEDQIYRIDHYLAKEMAQNLLVFRSSNSLFKRTWNKDFIERIEIVAAEKIGIQGRATFYEQTGALRDVVQSHLLQLTALILMELPAKDAWSKVPKHRLSALRALQPCLPDDTLRGQYEGYRDEVSNPHTATETFVSLTVFSQDEHWTGVPITLTTGKALSAKHTEIKIHYRQDETGEANQLKLQIQPHEGIEVDLWSKRPGYNRELEQVRLHFDYRNQNKELPDAYEQVFLDAIRSDHSLFTSSEEVLEAWCILKLIQVHWNMTDEDLIQYKPGSKPDEILAKRKSAG
jgi:glucose-6-phosphate 1-dehydrogenase